MLWTKFKAGALQLTLFIIVVIALLLTAFILLVHTHKQFQVQTNFIVEATRNTTKGIDYALQNTILLNDTTTIQLNEDYKNLKVYRNFWGVFEKITVVSQIKNNRFQKAALIGSIQPENNRKALYVQDNNKPLVLVGNTKIEGVAYIPKQGVKPGTISGQSYYGSQLIYGNTRVSNRLPKVFIETISQINAIESRALRVKENQFLNLESGKDYKNSFFEPTQIVFSNSQINLNHITLIGNIVVQSKTKIIVETSSNLKDIILIAPEIEIQNNVKGNFQAIASKKINVGESVKLQYPSALVLNEKKEISQQETTSQSIKHNYIVINANSTIKGLVLFLGKNQPNNYKTQIKLKAQSTIIGELYCNQNTELIGTVYGTIYTHNFIANQSGSIYQNHIYNGTIIINELPQKYVGLAFNNSKKDVIKWLY